MARRSRAEREGTEDEHGLLDAQLLAPLAALGEEAEHLDGAGGADGGEVRERGRGALAHGTAAVLRQLAELVEGRGRLAALPRAAAAEEPHQLWDGRGVRADAAFVDVDGGEPGVRRGREPPRARRARRCRPG